MCVKFMHINIFLNVYYLKGSDSDPDPNHFAESGSGSRFFMANLLKMFNWNILWIKNRHTCFLETPYKGRSGS